MTTTTRTALRRASARTRVSPPAGTNAAPLRRASARIRVAPKPQPRKPQPRKPQPRKPQTRTSQSQKAQAQKVEGQKVEGQKARSQKAQRSRKVTPSGARLSMMIGLVTIALTLFGLVMVLSASSVTSVHQFEASPFYQFQRQAAWAAIGGFAYFVARRIDYRMLQRFAPAFLGGAVLLLVAVLIPGVGRNINGSSRWLGVGPLVIQPSEIAKLVMIVFIADVLTRRAKKMDRPELTVRPVVTVVGLLSVLMILQPKLGTPLILAAVAMLMLFLAGARISSLASWAAVGVLGAALMAYAVPYRRARLLAFIDPWADPYGIGLQTIQSQVGIASGGLFGVGLGAGRTKWGFLPYAHSDFIFAIVAEEVGLIGAATLITAFLLLGYLGVRTALNAPDRFGMLLAAGITGWLLIQAFLNIGMAMGLLPITGEPLPFVSAGGSSLVMTLGAVGLLANIARQTRRS
jgi:cell division protein FtsW